MMHDGNHFVGPLIEISLTGLIILWPLWRIFRRAGFHPAWSLLIFLPGLGWLIIYLVLAFRTWPALRTDADKIGRG